MGGDRAGYYPDEFLDRLRDRADLLALVRLRVSLRKQGGNWVGLCPFHQEKTPSFMVHPDKGIFKCFGCGASGDALSFVMRTRALAFHEAVEELAEWAGLSLPERARTPEATSTGGDVGGVPAVRARRTQYQLLEACARYFREALHDARGVRARDYLQRRGLGPELWDRFGLGYAPPGWQNLLDHFGAETRDALVEVGMVIQRQDGETGPVRHYDRFRDRLMFPIQDLRGRYVSFGGRILGPGEPKYLNGPETSLYAKGELLYGLNLAQEAVRQAGYLLIVEGYMDRIAMAMHGFDAVAATLGTAVTPAQVERIWQRTQRVIFCFDGDTAGYQAAWRALDRVIDGINSDRQVRFLFLPSGMDPDDFLRHNGAAAMAEQIDQTTSLWDFLYAHLTRDLTLQHPEDRATLVHRMQHYLQRITDTVLRQFYMDDLAQRLGVPVWRLFRGVTTTGRVKRSSTPGLGVATGKAGAGLSGGSGRSGSESPMARGRNYEQLMMAILLRFPQLVGEYEESLVAMELANPAFGALLAELLQQDHPGAGQYAALAERILHAEPVVATIVTLEDARHELHGCLSTDRLRQLRRRERGVGYVGMAGGQDDGVGDDPWSDAAIQRVMALKREEQRLRQEKLAPPEKPVDNGTM
jgi:DNA primase